jgi:hypothetical protein
MKVKVEVHQTEVENEDGRTIDGLELKCSRCDHVVEVMGTQSHSAARGAVMLREECPFHENNRYEPDW